MTHSRLYRALRYTLIGAALCLTNLAAAQQPSPPRYRGGPPPPKGTAPPGPSTWFWWGDQQGRGRWGWAGHWSHVPPEWDMLGKRKGEPPARPPGEDPLKPPPPPREIDSAVLGGPVRVTLDGDTKIARLRTEGQVQVEGRSTLEVTEGIVLLGMLTLHDLTLRTSSVPTGAELLDLDGAALEIVGREGNPGGASFQGPGGILLKRGAVITSDSLSLDAPLTLQGGSRLTATSAIILHAGDKAPVAIRDSSVSSPSIAVVIAGDQAGAPVAAGLGCLQAATELLISVASPSASLNFGPSSSAPLATIDGRGFTSINGKLDAMSMVLASSEGAWEISGGPSSLHVGRDLWILGGDRDNPGYSVPQGRFPAVSDRSTRIAGGSMVLGSGAELVSGESLELLDGHLKLTGATVTSPRISLQDASETVRPPVGPMSGPRGVVRAAPPRTSGGSTGGSDPAPSGPITTPPPEVLTAIKDHIDRQSTEALRTAQAAQRGERPDWYQAMLRFAASPPDRFLPAARHQFEELMRLPPGEREARAEQLSDEWRRKIWSAYGLQVPEPEPEEPLTEQERAAAMQFLETPKGKKAVEDLMALAFLTNSRMDHATTMEETFAILDGVRASVDRINADLNGGAAGPTQSNDPSPPGPGPSGPPRWRGGPPPTSQGADSTPPANTGAPSQTGPSAAIRSWLIAQDKGDGRSRRELSTITGNGVLAGDVRNLGVLAPQDPSDAQAGPTQTLRIVGAYTHEYDGAIELSPTERTYWNKPDAQNRPRLDAAPAIHITGKAEFVPPPHHGPVDATQRITAALQSERPRAKSAIRVAESASFPIQVGDVHRVLWADRGIQGRPATLSLGPGPADPSVFFGVDIWHPGASFYRGPMPPELAKESMVLDLLTLRTPRRLIVDAGGLVRDVPLGLADDQTSRRPLSHGLVLVTHGTNALMTDIPPGGLGPAAAEGLAGLAHDMARFAREQGLADRWDVATFDWREYAAGSLDRRGCAAVISNENALDVLFVLAGGLAAGGGKLVTSAGWAALSAAEKATYGQWLLQAALKKAGEMSVKEGLKGMGVDPDAVFMQLGFSPFESARIGREIGISLADWLLDSGIDRSQLSSIHLLSHSSGSWLIDGFAKRIKERALDFGPSGPPEIQLTFFDIFMWPRDTVAHATQMWQPGLGPLSDAAAFIEHYVDGRLPGTRDDHPHGANIELVWLDPDLTISVGTSLWSNATGGPIGGTPFTHQIPMSAPEYLRMMGKKHPADIFSFGGGFSLANLEHNIGHAWPYEWYQSTVRRASGSAAYPASVWCRDHAWRNWGFVLSPLYRDSLSPAERASLDARVAALRGNTDRHILPEPGDCN